MEIIIGREEGLRRLHCIADGREFNVGQPNSVPTSVSRKHCKLTINGSNINIENLKVQNHTFVDGTQIFSKGITVTSKVELGHEKYLVPLQQVLDIATGKAVEVQTVPSQPQQQQQQQQPGQPQTFSLRPLKAVWEEYNQQKMDIQEKAAKKANQQRIQGIVSMFGMALGLLPIPVIFRAVCVIAALGLGIFFFIRGSRSSSIQRQLYDLDEEFAKKYQCPNPNCGKPFGAVPYRQIEYNKQCFACGCKYTH